MCSYYFLSSRWITSHTHTQTHTHTHSLSLHTHVRMHAFTHPHIMHTLNSLYTAYKKDLIQQLATLIEHMFFIEYIIAAKST